MNQKPTNDYKIPSPASVYIRDHMAEKLAAERILRSEAVQQLQRDLEQSVANVMKELSNALTNGKISYKGGDIRIDELVIGKIDLFDDAHCQMLQGNINKLLERSGWEGEVYPATLVLSVYPLKPVTELEKLFNPST